MFLSSDAWREVIDRLRCPVTLLAFRLSCRDAAFEFASFVPPIKGGCGIDNVCLKVEGMSNEKKIAVLRWMSMVGFGNGGIDGRCTTVAMNCAARHGQLEIVKWLHANRTEGCTTDAMDGAAATGHLETVKWLHENREEGCTTYAMVRAAANRHLETVKWLHANRRPHDECDGPRCGV